MAEITLHYEGPIVTRSEAKERGDKFYFDKVVCPYGHVSQRYVRSYGCCQCERTKRGQSKEKIAAKKHAYYLNNKENIKIKRKEYIEKNKERISEYMKAYKERNKEKCAFLEKKWYLENRERAREVKKKYYQKNKERIDSYIKSWCLENPEKKAAHTRNRKARKRNATGKHTDKEILDLFEKQKGRCASCLTKMSVKRKRPDTFTVDHIIALALGGTNSIDNIQLLCKKCNCSKQDKTPLEWAQENGRLL